MIPLSLGEGGVTRHAEIMQKVRELISTETQETPSIPFGRGPRVFLWCSGAGLLAMLIFTNWGSPGSNRTHVQIGFVGSLLTHSDCFKSLLRTSSQGG